MALRPAKWCAAILLLLGAIGQGTELRAAEEPCVESDYSAEGRTAEIMLDALADSMEVPGLAVAIAVDGQVVFAEGRGFADLDGRVPATPDTRFRLASVSKLFTAAALARLVEAGKLDWHSTVRDYVPGFPDKGHPITPYQLAGHLGGIRNYQPKDFEGDQHIDRRHFATTIEALSIFSADPLVAEPGTSYRYSTLGYTLLMAVVEGASGTDFSSALRANVLEPLGLAAVREDRLGAIDPSRTTFYDRSTAGFIEAPPIDPSYKWGGGGLLGSARDLVSFGAAHLQPGFLSRATLTSLFQTQRDGAGQPTGVGVGWRVGVDSWGRRVAHHAGSMTGGRSVLLVYPDDGVAVALLSNLALNPLAAEASAQMLADPFVYRRSTGRTARQVIPAGAYRYAFERGADSGVLEYRPGAPALAGSMTTPASVRRYAERFGIPTGDRIPIVFSRIDENDALIVLASPVGLFGIRARFGLDDFQGEIVALNASRLSGTLAARRIATDSSGAK